MGRGEFTVAGLDSIIAAGPFIAALAGVGAGGVVGGILGALLDLRIRPYRATPHESRGKTGGFLLSVYCDDGECARKAETIMKNRGADAVSFSGTD
jgi:hypothetical protein